jgi:hypothetical protein
VIAPPAVTLRQSASLEAINRVAVCVIEVHGLGGIAGSDVAELVVSPAALTGTSFDQHGINPEADI